MVRTIVFILLNLLVMGSFAQSSADILRTTDLAFSQLSVEKGMRAAFLAYADEQPALAGHRQALAAYRARFGV